MQATQWGPKVKFVPFDWWISILLDGFFFFQFHRLSRQNNMNDGSTKQDHQFGF